MSEEYKFLKDYIEIENPAGKIRFFITDSPSDYIDFQCSECGSVCSVKFFGNLNDAAFCEMQIECLKCDNKLEFPYKCNNLEDHSKVLIDLLFFRFFPLSHFLSFSRYTVWITCVHFIE